MNEILKQLDREGKLQSIFHPEIYSLFVNWVLEGEKGDFEIPTLTRTGMESKVSLDAALASFEVVTTEEEIAINSGEVGEHFNLPQEETVAQDYVKDSPEGAHYYIATGN